MVEIINTNFSRDAFFESRLAQIGEDLKSTLISKKKLKKTMGDLFSIADLTENNTLRGKVATLVHRCQNVWVDRRVEDITDRAQALANDIKDLEGGQALSESNKRLLMVARKSLDYSTKPTLLDFENTAQVSELLFETALHLYNNEAKLARMQFELIPDDIKEALSKWGDTKIADWAADNMQLVEAIVSFITGHSVTIEEIQEFMTS